MFLEVLSLRAPGICGIVHAAEFRKWEETNDRENGPIKQAFTQR